VATKFIFINKTKFINTCRLKINNDYKLGKKYPDICKQFNATLRPCSYNIIQNQNIKDGNRNRHFSGNMKVKTPPTMASTNNNG
jgi:hypothetical protein